MKDNRGNYRELQKGETFKQYELRVFRRRVEALLDAVDHGMPDHALAVSAGLLIHTTVCAFGVEALAEFGRTYLVNRTRTEYRICTLHADDAHRIRIKSREMCDECWERGKREFAASHKWLAKQRAKDKRANKKQAQPRA